MRGARLTRFVGVCTVLAFAGLWPTTSVTQTVLSVPASSIASGEKAACTIKMDTASNPGGDRKLDVRFVDTLSNWTKIAAATVIQVDGHDVHEYAVGDSGSILPVGDALAKATVSVMRKDARKSLCDVVTYPLAPQLVPSTSEYTAFAANGEIGKVLRGESSSNLSGSLGMEHRRLHRGWGPSENFFKKVLRGLWPFTAQGEEARAFITIAGTADTLNSSSQSAFGAAVLDPKLSGSGFLDGANIEYYPFSPVNSVGGTWGPLARATIARSLWRVDTTTANSPQQSEPITRAVPLTAFDLGFRFIFVNHLEDPKGNTYSLGFDPRFAWRYLSPNTAADSAVIHNALGEVARTHGGPALGMWIRLRNVTASADILNIHRKKGEKPVDGLTGLQSLVKFSYSSWLFLF